MTTGATTCNHEPPHALVTLLASPLDTLPGYGYADDMLNEGIQRMVDEDRYCIDVVMQVSAARSALAKVSEVVLGRHFSTCMVEAFETGSEHDRQEKIEELMKVFSRHGRV